MSQWGPDWTKLPALPLSAARGPWLLELGPQILGLSSAPLILSSPTFPSASPSRLLLLPNSSAPPLPLVHSDP